jgi:c-di-GMP-related signal transduction protein
VGVAALGDEVSGGLLKVPLLKAMFRELIGKKIGRLRATNELFLMGLLSVMDALLNVPMTQVLNETPVDEASRTLYWDYRAGSGRF